MIAFIVVLAYVLLGSRKGQRAAYTGTTANPAKEDEGPPAEPPLEPPAGLPAEPPSDSADSEIPPEPYKRKAPHEIAPAPKALYQAGRERRNSMTANKTKFNTNDAPPEPERKSSSAKADTFTAMESYRRYILEPHVLDGSNSPLSQIRDNGHIDLKLCDEMRHVEELTQQDWYDPNKTPEFMGRYNAMLANDWIMPFGNVPTLISSIVARFVADQPNSDEGPTGDPGQLFTELSRQALQHPKHRERKGGKHSLAWTEDEIVSQAEHPEIVSLLVWFMLPYRGYLCKGCINKKLEVGHAHPAAKMASEGSVVPVRKVFEKHCTPAQLDLIDWLEYISVRFMIARLFSGRMAEFWDDSVRFGISPDEQGRRLSSGGHFKGTKVGAVEKGGFVANVVLFAPAMLGDQELPQGWFDFYKDEKKNFIQAVFRIAQNWTHTRCPGRDLPFMSTSTVPAVPGVSAERIEHTAVQPIYSTRLIIRPGFPIKLASTGDWKAEAFAARNYKYLPRDPFPVQISIARIRAAAELSRVGQSFRLITQLVQPSVLIFQNERQNAWHPKLREGKVPLHFTPRELETVLGWATVGLQRRLSGADDEDVEQGLLPFEVVPPPSQTIRAIDLGGMLPFVEKAGLGETASAPVRYALDLLFSLADSQTEYGKRRAHDAEDMTRRPPIAVPRARRIVLPFVEPADQPNGGAYLLFDTIGGFLQEIIDGRLPVDKRRDTTIIFTLPDASEREILRRAGLILDYFDSLLDTREPDEWGLTAPYHVEDLEDIVQAVAKAVTFASVDDAQPTKWPYQSTRLDETGFVANAIACIRDWNRHNNFVDAETGE